MISKIGRIGRSVLFLSYLVVVCYCMNSFVCLTGYCWAGRSSGPGSLFVCGEQE